VSDKALFDPGLQPERTALAWRRTALTLAVGAVVSFRLLPPVLGLWSIALGAAGVVLSAATWILAGRRARRVQVALLRSSGPLPGGGLPLLLALVVTSAATLGLLYTALR
jgi:putative membrane protein